MPMENKDLITLLIALYGAIASTIGLVVNWLNRRDNLRKDSEARQPWANVWSVSGDAWHRTIVINFYNPSNITIVIESLEIIKPESWQFTKLKKKVLLPDEIDMDETGKRIKGEWRLVGTALKNSPSVISADFIIARSGWTGKNFIHAILARDLPEFDANFLFRGYFDTATRSPVLIKSQLATHPGP